MIELNQIKLGEQIKDAREKRYSQAEFAKLIKVRQSTLSRYENGLTLIPLDKFKAICMLLNLSANYILEITDYE